MATQFKRYARGGRFKKPVIGDQGISALRQRDQTIIDSLQLSRNQQAEIDRDQMTEMEKVFNREAQNIKDLQALEDKIYANKRDNIKLRAQREVESLKGQADEYGRSAKHWEQLSPKLGKALFNLSEGVGNLANRLGYDQALRNQADHDTLSIWEENFEEGIQIAHDSLQKDENDLEAEGATPTQLAGLEQTSAFYKSGTVHYLAKDLIDNVDAHMTQGLAMYTQNFGPITTIDEYNKALKWVQRTVEESVGISTYKYHGGVRKWREAFNAAAAAKTKTWTTARLHKVTTTQYKEHKNIFEATPDYKQRNLGNMIRYVQFHLKDKEGDPVAENTGEAIKFIYLDWASDLTIPEDELIRRLDLLTPEDGRQEGLKASVGGRYPKLKEEMEAKRLEAVKQRNTNFNIASKAKSIEAFKQVTTFMGSEDANDPEKLQQLKQDLKKNNPHSGDAVKWIENIQETNKLDSTKVLTTAQGLIRDQEWLGALTFIEGNITLSGPEKKDLIGQIQPIKDWSSVGYKFDDTSKGLEAELKRALGYKGKDELANEAVSRMLVEAKRDLIVEYTLEYERVKNNPKLSDDGKIRAAYGSAMATVTTRIAEGKNGIGPYAVINARDRKGFNVPTFASQVQALDENDLSSVSNSDYVKLIANNQTHTLLDKQGVLTVNQENALVKSINNGSPLDAADGLVNVIEGDLPNNHNLKGNTNMIYRRLLMNSENEEVRNAATLVPPDNLEAVEGLLGGWRSILYDAHSNKDLISRVAWVKTIEETGNPPLRPEIFRTDDDLFTVKTDNIDAKWRVSY